MSSKIISVFDMERYDGEWPPTDARACLDWLSAKVESIPAEFRKNATIEFESASGYEGEHYARIKIQYLRPETPEETAHRQAERQQQIDQRKAFLKAQLADLESTSKPGEKL